MARKRINLNRIMGDTKNQYITLESPNQFGLFGEKNNKYSEAS